jgi:predicted small metal-binding protein
VERTLCAENGHRSYPETKGKQKEFIMARKYIDCRDYPSDIKCTIALSADTDEELLEAVVQHGVRVHGYADTPEFRKKIRSEFKEGTPER